MGEVVNMMISGILCCQCGAYLHEDVMEQELGFPVICEDCFEELSAKEKEEYKDRVETIFHDPKK